MWTVGASWSRAPPTARSCRLPTAGSSPRSRRSRRTRADGGRRCQHRAHLHTADHRATRQRGAHGLHVMAGLSWPQHVPFLDDARMRAGSGGTPPARCGAWPRTRRCCCLPSGTRFQAASSGGTGNAVSSGSWASCFGTSRRAAPASLFTYVNYPPTEFLDLDGFDLCAFNVYLHREAAVRAYLARLQHVAGDRPLLLAEAGSDSLREGLDAQARISAMNLRCAFEEGACGAVAYAWTDQWWRGGSPVHDWAFGLVDADRTPSRRWRPRPRYSAKRRFPTEARPAGPRSRCGLRLQRRRHARRMSRLAHRADLSGHGGHRRQRRITRRTATTARRHPDVTVIDLLNGGLGAARNAGLAAASGEIVAFTDADCRVDPDWLTYLVQPMLVSEVVGAGGPNVVPPDDPWVAQCVARAPGGPTHVMLDDRTAEHVPGCNMAFRRDALLSIDGFNPVYLRAGDDVDICWRLQAQGLRIGFAPAALVWHHHRARVQAYWRQQVGYGEGEPGSTPTTPRSSSPDTCCGTDASTANSRSTAPRPNVGSIRVSGAPRRSRRYTAHRRHSGSTFPTRPRGWPSPWHCY